MSYDEEQQRRSRVVVETPNTRREVVQTQTQRIPERRGYSTGVVAAVALTAIAATAVIFLFLTNQSDDSTTNVNISARPPATPIPQQTVIIQQAATPLPTPIVIQQVPPTTTQPAPVIITPPGGGSTTAPSTSAPPATSVPDDTSIQNNVSKRIEDDAELGATDIIANVSGGKATLTGTVNSPDLKRRAERVVLSIKGVRTVDNQIAVLPSPGTTSTP
ncbi:MAG TPA: BON domain-containing protein [Pyrinomonadaceae bacterium]|jgi:hypothetical protein